MKIAIFIKTRVKYYFRDTFYSNTSLLEDAHFINITNEFEILDTIITNEYIIGYLNNKIIPYNHNFWIGYDVVDIDTEYKITKSMYTHYIKIINGEYVIKDMRIENREKIINELIDGK